MVEKSSGLVDIVVVTKGADNFIESCLSSLVLQTHAPSRIIIIDNSAGRVISQKFADDRRFKCLSQQSDLAYGQALNLGITMTSSPFVLCLNDDVILDKQYIENALKGFDTYNRTGMVSGKILRNDPKTIDSTGLFLSFWRAAKERDHGAEDTGQRKTKGVIFGVTGAAAFYRREMLEDIKLEADYFDSDFGFFYEDLDLAWRANNFGWKGYYIPSAIAYHVRGLTARGAKGAGKRFARRFLSDELYLSLIRNRHFCILKNEKPLNFLFSLPFIVLYDFVSLCFTLLFRPRLLMATWAVRSDYSEALRKRELIKNKIKKAKWENDTGGGSAHALTKHSWDNNG